MVVDGKTIKLRRVVITGFGLVTPLGCGSESVCNRLFDNQCGITRIKSLSLNDNISLLSSTSSTSSSSLLSSCSINAAAFVPLHHDHPWNIEIKEKSTSSSSLSLLSSIGKSKNLSKFIEYAILASELALDHANIKNNNLSSYYNLNRCGVTIGNGGIGSLHEIIKANNSLELSYKKLSPYFIPKILNNMASGQVSIKYGLKGE
jgi:3-oxoacyl-[acyl-carrier-protein] synthase II